MRHPDDRIRRYLDGELDPAGKASLYDHLAACPRCRDELAVLERLDARLRQLDRLTPAHDFAARTRTRIAVLPPQRARSRLGPMALAIAGLVGVVLAGEQLSALGSGLLAVVNDLTASLLALANGEAMASAGALGAPAEVVGPTLVVGLCLLGLAGLLILRQSIESQA